MLDAFVLAPGEAVGDMTIVAPHRRGGFAQLYEARLGATGRRIALKLLLPHAAATRSAIDRLRLEASVVAELDHPHVVEVFGCGQHRDAPYIAMEWIEGRTLADEIAVRGALSLAMTLEVFEQIGGAVAAAHARNVVHRDLTANNVMLLADRETVVVKLIDFGIAKVVRGDVEGITTSLEVLGTPVAMSPEQLLGAAIDERTDLYGLGVLLFHCLAGRPPFAGRSAVETEEMHLSAEPPRASDVVAVPPAVDAVIRRAMAKSPAARHPSVAAFLADLRDALAERPAARRGAAIYAEARAGSTSDDLDALDVALVDAHHLLRAAGFEVLAEVGTAILAGGALPGDGAELHRRAVAVATAIARPRMRVQFRIAIDTFDGARTRLGPAALAGLPPGVFATEAVLAAAPELAGTVTGAIRSV